MRRIYYIYIYGRTHIEGRSLIEGQFPHRGPILSHNEGRFIFPTSRAMIVIYARSGCIVSCDVRVFGAVTSRSKQTSTDQDGCDYSRKGFVETKIVTTFPDEEISFFRIKGISIILISGYQNLVSNTVMKVLLKIKHINNYAYKTKIE